jgi:transcriptional regulator with XRE-family HTH domain
MGEELREQREGRGWSFGDLHLATGISKSHLCDLEHGLNSFTLEQRLALEAVFGMVEGGLETLGRRRLRREPARFRRLCSQ